jgi:hypothetical protein
MNKTSELPPLDPEFLVVERRPRQLHAHARGLLEHLRYIRSGGKARRYPVTKIKAAAAWLIESYARAGVSPSLEAARLVRELLRPAVGISTTPVRQRSEKAYWAAIEFEAGRSPDPKGKQPSAATLYSVAKHVRPRLPSRSSQKTAEAAVRGWRSLSHYKDNVALQRPGQLRVKN